MKNKMIYALGAMMLVGVTSCDLTEKPSSFYEKDTYFVTEGKAQMAVVGIYDCLETTDYYGQNIMPFFGSDDMFMVRGTGSDGTRRDISHYLYNASNTWIASVWRCAYQALDRANVAIASIEAMSGFAENKNLQEIDGQARFLRAYIAFDLVKFFGDVPFSTEYTNGFANTSKPRTDRELIYDQIIEDLNYAKTYLKSGREVASSEIPCSGAAHTLLMRVYLQRAGYSLNCSSRQLTRPDDTTRKGYFEAVIKEWEALKAEGYHGFYAGGYEQLFKNYSQLTLDNQESLWEIAFEPNQGLKDNAGVWATYNGPLVDAPGSYPGTSSYMGRANAFFRVLPAWKNFFEEGDERRDVMVCTYQYKWDADKKAHKLVENKKLTDWYPGKWRREWMPKGFVDPNNTGVNYCPLRYADVVLMAAEAYNEIGNTPEAWRLLNEVRHRAGATETNSLQAYKAAQPNLYELPYFNSGDEADNFRTALYWERGFELAFEGQRKYDLLRWGILGDALKLFQSKMDKSLKGKYVAGDKFIKGKHELFPIPLGELQANPALKNQNNPGYE